MLPSGELRRAVHARVRAAEDATARTCIWCGAIGQAWTDGWLHTACDRHRRRDAIPLAKALELQAAAARQRKRKDGGDE